MKVAEEQQAELALAQLAIQRAENERVKNFGAHIIEDHKKIKREVERMASQQYVGLQPRLNQYHERQVAELSQLTGAAFDRAYLNYAFQDHETTVKELEQHAKTLPYPDIKRWIDETLPIINAHHEEARKAHDILQTLP